MDTMTKVLAGATAAASAAAAACAVHVPRDAGAAAPAGPVAGATAIF